MTRRRLILAVVVLCVALPRWAAAEPAIPAADRPTYAVGQRWLRDDGSYRLDKVEQDVYVFSTGAGREVRLTRDLGFVRLERDGTFFTFDPAPNLTWPLAVGRWGSISTTRSASGNTRGSRVIFTWRVEGTDAITIGAAKVPAFRILITQQFIGTGRITTERLWYAPDVRQFVRGSGDDWNTFHFTVVGFGDGDERLSGGRLESLAIQVRKLKGTVEVSQGDGTWRLATVGQRLAEGDDVRTADDSTLEVVLPNGAAMFAYDRTFFTLKKLEHDPRSGARNVNVHVATGAVRVVRGGGSPDPTRPSSFMVSTPSGVAAMRGEVNAVVSHQESGKESVVAAETSTQEADPTAFVTYVDYVSSGVQTIRPGHYVRQGDAKAPSRPTPLRALPPGLRDRLAPPTE